MIREHMKKYDWYPGHLAWRGYEIDAQPCRADLRGADLHGADLCWADLSRASLREADLSRANLHGADLREADLNNANLSEADLSEADLSEADLHGANLRGADLREADLSGADLSGADLHEVQIDYLTTGLHSAPEGDLIVWGKKSDHLIKMRVPADVERSCATTRKHRSASVVTLWIEGDIPKLAHSNQYGTVVYEVGKETKADSWDENRWNECSNGIHWFLTRAEAEAWEAW